MWEQWLWEDGWTPGKGWIAAAIHLPVRACLALGAILAFAWGLDCALETVLMGIVTMSLLVVVATGRRPGNGSYKSLSFRNLLAFAPDRCHTSSRCDAGS